MSGISSTPSVLRSDTGFPEVSPRAALWASASGAAPTAESCKARYDDMSRAARGVATSIAVTLRTPTDPMTKRNLLNSLRASIATMTGELAKLQRDCSGKGLLTPQQEGALENLGKVLDAADDVIEKELAKNADSFNAAGDALLKLLLAPFAAAAALLGLGKPAPAYP